MLRELAERIDDGARVRLLWDDESDRIVVRYRDPRTGEEFTAEVPSADALDAFRHPHAYRHGALHVG